MQNIFSKSIISLFLLGFLLSFTSITYAQEYCSLDKSYTKSIKSTKSNPKPKTYKVAKNNINKPKVKKAKKSNSSNKIKDNVTNKRNPVWLLFNYNHPVSGKDFNPKNGYGSINFNVGYNLWKMFSIEFYVGGRMSNDKSSKHIELMGESQSNGNLYKATGEEVTRVDYSLFDFGATLLFQPQFDKKVVKIMPYIGIGPLFSYSKASYKVSTNLNSTGPNVVYNISNNSGLDTSFDIGMKAKGGVRFNMVKNLMFGLNLEYIYLLGKNFSRKDLDLSTFSIGVEFGTTF